MSLRRVRRTRDDRKNRSDRRTERHDLILRYITTIAVSIGTLLGGITALLAILLR